MSVWMSTSRDPRLFERIVSGTQPPVNGRTCSGSARLRGQISSRASRKDARRLPRFLHDMTATDSPRLNPKDFGAQVREPAYRLPGFPWWWPTFRLCNRTSPANSARPTYSRVFGSEQRQKRRQSRSIREEYAFRQPSLFAPEVNYTKERQTKRAGEAPAPISLAIPGQDAQETYLPVSRAAGESYLIGAEGGGRGSVMTASW
jgi:hypothetical protein